MSATSSFDQRFDSSTFLLLYEQVVSRLGKATAIWLKKSLMRVAKGDRQALQTAFSLTARKVGKADLRSTRADSQRAHSAHLGWDFSHWRVDQAARTLLLLAFPSDDLTNYQQVVQQLFESADVNEQVALYQSLPVLPQAECFRTLATIGVRSAMTAVFEAIALRNPYPESYFSQSAWNQMVLKALFEGSPLFLIQGIDRRANEDLAKMLVAYAHERWSAKRSVSPELWRSVGPFASGEMVADLALALDSGDSVQREAAALTCYRSREARSLLNGSPEIIKSIQAGHLNWERIGKLVSPFQESFNVE